ncbi:hypothetical protein, partial [Mammaliicoccus stepanovicii]
RKILISIMASSIALSACGNDEVDKLEKKKSTLKEENRKHKKEILNLEDKNNTYKQKDKSLQSSINHIEKNSSSQFKTQYLKSSTQFINNTKTNISQYNKISKNIKSKPNDSVTQDKIDNIAINQKTITSQYKDGMDGKTIPKEFKALHKNMLNLSSDIEDVFNDLNKGYKKNDKKLINKSIKKLNSLKDEIDQIK